MSREMTSWFLPLDKSVRRISKATSSKQGSKQMRKLVKVAGATARHCIVLGANQVDFDNEWLHTAEPLTSLSQRAQPAALFCTLMLAAKKLLVPRLRALSS